MRPARAGVNGTKMGYGKKLSPMCSNSLDAADLGALNRWLESRGRHLEHLTALPGDVSARLYYRVESDDGSTFILAHYPSEVHSSCGKFLRTTELLQQVSVRVPTIEFAECETGLMLLEDVGAETLYSLHSSSWDHLLPSFHQAHEYIERIQTISLAECSAINPDLGEDLLWSELEQTWRLFLEPSQLVGSARQAKLLWHSLQQLCANLGADTIVTCHRDFMARNLVPCDNGQDLIVLDHQDLRPGPRFYDLASLLNDSLFPPRDVEEMLLEISLSSDADRMSYHRAAAQRTLKAIGTFEAFRSRGSTRHVRLISPTFDRALHHLSELPEPRQIVRELGPVWRDYLSNTQTEDLLD